MCTQVIGISNIGLHFLIKEGPLIDLCVMVHINNPLLHTCFGDESVDNTREVALFC